MEKKGIKSDNGDVKKGFFDFYEKYRTDSKYKAKIQLIGYLSVVFLIIIYVNVSAATSSSRVDIPSFSKEEDIPSSSLKESSLESLDLLKKIKDNYEYEVSFQCAFLHDEVEEEENIRYSGRRYENNMEITVDDSLKKNMFYKVDSRYYEKNDEGFELVPVENIYSFYKDYVEFESLREYLDKASLDHVTNYSSGKKESVYHLRVSDIIKSSMDSLVVEFTVLEENDILTITVDYLNLMKQTSKDVVRSSATYTYKNIGSVLAFSVMDK